MPEINQNGDKVKGLLIKGVVTEDIVALRLKVLIIKFKKKNLLWLKDINRVNLNFKSIQNKMDIVREIIKC